MLDCFAEGKHVDAPNAWWWYGYTGESSKAFCIFLYIQNFFLACVVLMMEQYYSDLQPQTDAALRLNQKLENIMTYVAMQRRVCSYITMERTSC